jgi:hypothetical protein
LAQLRLYEFCTCMEFIDTLEYEFYQQTKAKHMIRSFLTFNRVYEKVFFQRFFVNSKFDNIFSLCDIWSFLFSNMSIIVKSRPTGVRVNNLESSQTYSDVKSCFESRKMFYLS